jgi:hypothetical protein
MSDSIGSWFGSLFGGSTAANAAGLGWSELGAGQFGPPSPANVAADAAGRGIANPLDPANQTTLGLTDKQWGQFSSGLGQAARGMGGTAQQAGQQQQQRAAGSGVHPGNAAAFNAMLQQVMAQRARLMPGGAATASPPGLLGGGRG